MPSRWCDWDGKKGFCSSSDSDSKLRGPFEKQNLPPTFPMLNVFVQTEAVSPSPIFPYIVHGCFGRSNGNKKQQEEVVQLGGCLEYDNLSQRDKTIRFKEYRQLM